MQAEGRDAPPRRSKRRKLARYQPSALQNELELATGQPGGTAKILRLVQNASDGEIEALNAAGWTPLVGAIFRLGKNTTKNGNSAKSERELMQMIRAFHDRGVSFNSGAWFASQYQRPLVVAAYYGYYSAVRLMIELGALPDLGDGEGRNAWFAAFQNPMASGKTHRFRECDRLTAQTLLDMGVITKDLGEWRSSAKGTKCYINGQSGDVGSAMYKALRDKNVEVVDFLRRRGAVLTDHGYMKLKNWFKVKTCLLPVVAQMLARDDDTEKGVNATIDSEHTKRAKVWSPETDWSFPPTWKVGVRLCSNCGLPEDVFRNHVKPFLGRDWFYTPDDTAQSARKWSLGPSLGERMTPLPT